LNVLYIHDLYSFTVDKPQYSHSVGVLPFNGGKDPLIKKIPYLIMVFLRNLESGRGKSARSS